MPFAPAEPEPPLPVLGACRKSLNAHREALRGQLDRLHVWLATIAIKYPRITYACFDLPRMPEFDPGLLRKAGRALRAGLAALAHRAGSRVSRIDWRPKHYRLEPQYDDLPADSVRGALVRVMAYVGGIAVISVVAAELLRTAPVIAAGHNDVTAPIRAEWITVDKPFPAFHLGLPGFAEEGQYTIRRHTEGNGRKDIMSWGEPGRTLRYVMLEIYRPGAEFTGFGETADEIALRAIELGPNGAARPSLPIKSKFGLAATVDFAIGRFSGGHCVGFMRAFEEPRLQITGLSCNMDSLVDREAITCALDRLTLMSAGSHPDIAKLFAQAELKRSFCGQREPLMYATPRRPGDTGNMSNLNLRGRTSTR